jgi:hypothetical protein
MGPVITDVLALLGRDALFRAPFRNSISRGLPPDHAFKWKRFCSSGTFPFAPK